MKLGGSETRKKSRIKSDLSSAVIKRNVLMRVPSLGHYLSFLLPHCKTPIPNTETDSLTDSLPTLQ